MQSPTARKRKIKFKSSPFFLTLSWPINLDFYFKLINYTALIRNYTSAAATHRFHSQTVAKSLCTFACLRLGGGTHSWSQWKMAGDWVRVGWRLSQLKAEEKKKNTQPTNQTARLGRSCINRSRGGGRWGGRGFPRSPPLPWYSDCVCRAEYRQGRSLTEGLSHWMHCGSPSCHIPAGERNHWLAKRNKNVICSCCISQSCSTNKGMALHFLFALHHTQRGFSPFFASSWDNTHISRCVWKSILSSTLASVKHKAMEKLTQLL